MTLVTVGLRHKATRSLGHLLFLYGAATVTTLITVFSGVAAAQSSPSGVAVVASNSGEKLTLGGSADEFTLKLPPRSTCPGDSANDGFRVDSYMVPSAVAPTDVTFGSAGPEVNTLTRYDEFRQPLYDNLTAMFVNRLTAANEKPGEPGLIIDVPMFSLDVYSAGQVPPGPYNIGVACTLDGQAKTTWNTQITIEKDSTDKPAGVRWSVAGSGGSSDKNSASSIVRLLVLIFVLLLVVVLAFGLYRWWRFRQLAHKE